MMLRSAKKLEAQEKYYSHQNGQSPLVKNLKASALTKPPVHERLGNVNLKQRWLPIFGTNTSSILPKRRFNNQKNKKQQQGWRNHKNQKMMRMYSAQDRLLRIRNGLKPGPPNNQKIFGQGAQRIRLHRANVVTPMNYQVQVRNNYGAEGAVQRHNIRKSLTPRYQEEIRLVQLQLKFRQHIEFTEPLLITATKVSLNDRFLQQV